MHRTLTIPLKHVFVQMMKFLIITMIPGYHFPLYASPDSRIEESLRAVLGVFRLAE